MAILNHKCFGIAIAKKSLNFKLFKNCQVLLKQASSQCFIPQHLPTGSSHPGSERWGEAQAWAEDSSIAQG